jgi:hypothetical protein
LWNISSSETAISTDFVTQAVVESKERNPETLQTIPRNCEKILERKAFSSKKNEDYPLSAKACVVRNSRPKKLSENRETTAATATSVKVSCTVRFVSPPYNSTIVLILLIMLRFTILE